MKGKEAAQLIGGIMAERLPGFEWSRKDSELFRRIEGGWQKITLDIIRTSSASLGKIASFASIRIDDLSDRFAHLLPVLTPLEPPRIWEQWPTLHLNSDNLMSQENIDLIHSFPLDEETVVSRAEAYAEAARTDIIPVLEKYSLEQNLFDHLSQTDPRKWITADRKTRFTILLAIFAKRGDVENFDKTAEEYERWCQKYGPLETPLAAAMKGIRPV